MSKRAGFIFSLIFAGFLMLSACGQKGALFIPDEQPLDKPQTETPQTTKKAS